MNKLTIGIAGALVLAMALSGTTTGAANVTLDDGVGDFSGDSEPGRHECGNGLLPQEVSEALGTNVHLTWEAQDIGVECNTGEHTRDTIGLTHGFSDFAYDDWEVTIQSWLRHDGNDRGFQCQFFGDGSLSCAGLGGDFPPLGSTYTHECIASGFGTDVEELYLRGWGCQVTY